MSNQPIVALLYDFDKTLSTQDMQNYSFIPSLGLAPGDFWKIANDIGRRERMDSVLAYMYAMLREAERRGRPFTRETLNRYGELLGVQAEHYIISSGLREIIEGSPIAGAFKEIFASEFLYDEEGRPVWPRLAVNFTAKTQFIYRINKGVLDVSDDRTLNDSMPDNSKRVPFTNMIYLGDGLSDVPCMKMMRAYGGQAIAVYQAVNKAGVEQLLRQRRVDFIYPADYREGSDLEITVKNIIRKMAVSQELYEENAGQLRAIQ